jgi:hypothetical protein
MDDPDLFAALREHATVLERDAPAVTPAVARATATQVGSRRRWIAGGALAAAALLVVVVVVVGRHDDQRVYVTPSSTSTTTSTSTSTVPTTPTTSLRWPATLPTVLADITDNLGNLPDSGVAVVDRTGKLTLYGSDGVPLPVAEGTARFSIAPPDRSAGLVLTDGGSGTRVTMQSLDPQLVAPPDCATPIAGGGLVASICEDGQSIRVVDGSGQLQLTIGYPPLPRAPNGQPNGHWRYAIPSPDGHYLAAQWSGECEKPTAFFIRRETDAGDTFRTVTGDSQADDAPESIVVGWTPDGKMITELPFGSCGKGVANPGIHLIDRTVGNDVLLQREHSELDRLGVAVWTKG